MQSLERSGVACAQVYHHGEQVLTHQQFQERFVHAPDGRVHCGENNLFANTYASQFGTPMLPRSLRDPLNSLMLVHNANAGQQVRRADEYEYEYALASYCSYCIASLLEKPIGRRAYCTAHEPTSFEQKPTEECVFTRTAHSRLALLRVCTGAELMRMALMCCYRAFSSCHRGIFIFEVLQQ